MYAERNSRCHQGCLFARTAVDCSYSVAGTAECQAYFLTTNLLYYDWIKEGTFSYTRVTMQQVINRFSDTPTVEGGRRI